MNYIKLNYKSLNKKYFMYVDTNRYLADDLYIKKKIKIKYLKKEFNMKLYNQKYNLLLVKIPKKEEELFIECMNELDNKISSSDVNGYDEICNDLASYISDEKIKRKVKVR